MMVKLLYSIYFAVLTIAVTALVFGIYALMQS